MGYGDWAVHDDPFHRGWRDDCGYKPGRALCGCWVVGQSSPGLGRAERILGGAPRGPQRQRVLCGFCTEWKGSSKREPGQDHQVVGAGGATRASTWLWAERRCLSANLSRSQGSVQSTSLLIPGLCTERGADAGWRVGREWKQGPRGSVLESRDGTAALHAARPQKLSHLRLHIAVEWDVCNWERRLSCADLEVQPGVIYSAESLTWYSLCVCVYLIIRALAPSPARSTFASARRRET